MLFARRSLKSTEVDLARNVPFFVSRTCYTFVLVHFMLFVIPMLVFLAAPTIFQALSTSMKI
jgi:hypothetical protein